MDKYKRWIEDEGTAAGSNYEEPTVNKPDIKELLELAKKAQRLRTHGDHYETLPRCKKYRKETSPDKMIALLEYVRDLEEIIEDHKDLITYRGACQ